MDQATAPSSNIDLRNRKILIVDDERINIRLLEGILQAGGFRLEPVPSGTRALEVYPHFLPDLVLLDVVMPGMDGLETCRTLKKTYGNECAPVIFTTAKNAPQDVVAGLNAGGVDYMMKPFNSAEVLGRVRAQLKNRALFERHHELVTQLSKVNADKNRLLSTAASDLRDPLASIHTLVEFMRDGTVGKLTADQLDLVQTIHAASESMLAMLNDLIDVITNESGEIKLQLQRSNLVTLVEKCVYVANMDAAKKKTRIEFQAPADRASVEIDPAKMKQVVDNLLSNAVKYSPPGSTLTAEIKTDAGGAPCGFAVKDQGPGIPPGERDKLFKDFGRLSVAPTGGEKSTGLGLAICRKIVEAHGGTISAENLPGRGCEFRVLLRSQL